MQGVRTTRGCRGCRRRKKSCDLRQPVCARCQRFGVTCSYEERKWTFVNDTRSSSVSRQTTRDPSPVTGIAQGALSRAIVDLQVDACFWELYLPREDPALDGSIGGVLSAPWLPVIRALAEKDVKVRTAMQACAYAGLGWARDDSGLLRRGVEQYAAALKETNSALQDLALAVDDSVLACCRIFTLFEMFRRETVSNAPGQSQLQSWRTHAQGTYRLMQLRGPARHVSDIGRNLYDGVRITAAIQGLTTRRGNVFTNLSWAVPQPETLRDELFNLMCAIPDLLQQLDSFPVFTTYSSDPIDQQANLLMKKCLAVGTKLNQWEASAIASCEERCIDQDMSPDELSITRSLLEHCKLHGYGFFFLCAQYWAACIPFYGAVRMFQRKAVSTIEPPKLHSLLLQLPGWMSPEPHAQNIVRVASHFFEPGAGLWSAQSAVFPIGTALMYFVRTGRFESAAFKTLTAAFVDHKAGKIMRDFLHTVYTAQATL